MCKWKSGGRGGKDDWRNIGQGTKVSTLAGTGSRMSKLLGRTAWVWQKGKEVLRKISMSEGERPGDQQWEAWQQWSKEENDCTSGCLCAWEASMWITSRGSLALWFPVSQWRASPETGRRESSWVFIHQVAWGLYFACVLWLKVTNHSKQPIQWVSHAGFW